MARGEPTDVLSVRVPRRLAQRIRNTAASRGAPNNTVIEEALMLALPDVSPEAFVLDTLNGYESITATKFIDAGDVAEITEAEARREGRQLSTPRPITKLITVEARPERGGEP